MKKPPFQVLASLLASAATGPARAPVEPVEDWSELLDLATAHGVDGALRSLARSRGAELPEELDAELQRRTFIWRIRTGLMLAALSRVSAALDAADVEAVVLKGPVLAERFYPPDVFRPSTDLDVLVRERDLDLAVAALEPLGYLPSDPPARALYHRKHHYHITLGTGAEGFPLELHFFAHRTAGACVPADALIERSEAFETSGGARVRVLRAEDEVVYLAAHAAKHLEPDLRLLNDLALLIGRAPDLDWAIVAARAEAYGVACALALVLSDLETWLGVLAPLPASFPLRRRLRERLRRFDAARDWDGPLAMSIAVAHGVLVEDSPRAMASQAFRMAARIARRRAHRYFPRLVPDEWSG